ncbi:hypothetical protein MCOR25_003869 [Pyricularia grisea]|uniref:CFEM domain-containing protein n=1 Tax=Pyricularia grisea TaxID=148305 RepID=A0A6P8BCU0_PYRGI|nr:uncharacterized protein PgNI_03616 [Pyricularia grisea]KAI6371841.1 hypothetical protein MCOR25_003869 [Pyricularia grisea]TLD13579.1 hypothetical protein PgNI_03616 [Pyricularia grisea]
MRLDLQVAQLLLLLLSFVSVAHSAAIEGNLEKALSQLPECAFSCFKDAIGLSTCVAGNTTCICNDEVVTSSIVTCVRGACSINDQLVTLKVSKDACSQASRDNTVENRRVNWAMIALCTPFAILRLLSKVEFRCNKIGGGWLPSMPEAGWDDLCLFLAWCCTIVMGIIIGVPLEQAALGRDLWTLSKQQLIDTGYWIYVAEPIYMSSHAFLKASFLFFYLRVFGLAGSVSYFFGLCPMRPLLLGTLWVNLVISIILVGLSIGQCSPISYAWTQWVEDGPGTCIQSGKLLWAQAISSMLLDFWILALPLSQIARLQRSLPTKLGVAAMFSLGIITTAVSIVRARILDTTATSDNPGMMLANSATWSMVESSVGIVCACLPGMRKFIVRTIPQAWSWAGRSLGSRTSGSTDAQRQQQQDRHAPRSSVPRRLRKMSGSLLESTVMGADDHHHDAPYKRVSDEEMSSRNSTVTTTTGFKNSDIESYAMEDMKTGHETDHKTNESTVMFSGGNDARLSRPFSASLPSPLGKDNTGAETMSLPASPRIWIKPGSFNNYNPQGDESGSSLPR